MRFSAPELLAPHHDIADFDSGMATLDDCLRRRALGNQGSGASRTYACCEGSRVVAHYALASSAVGTTAAPGRFKRNMPDPIPVFVLARLAVASSRQGQGLGRALFRDAGLRVVQAADTIGIRGMLVHAVSDEAKAFHLRLGLSQSPLDAMTLMTTVAELRLALPRG